MIVGGTARLRAALLSFSGSEAEVAKWILDDPRRLLRLSMSEVADACQVSDTTVLRCARRAGFQGYTDLKLAIAQDTITETEIIQGEVGPHDDAATVISKVFAASAQALSDTQALLRSDAVDAVVSALEVAPAVSIAGVGTSSLVAQALYQRLARLGIRADAPQDVQLQFMHSSTLGREDLLFVISRTGVTKDLLTIAQQVRGNGGTVVCLTGNARSPLALESDIVLVAASNGYRSEPMASLVAMLSLMDAVLVRYAQQHADRAHHVDSAFAHAIVPKSL
jgi:RpiR family carbohydrate utilization transcriptional regulator